MSNFSFYAAFLLFLCLMSLNLCDLNVDAAITYNYYLDSGCGSSLAFVPSITNGSCSSYNYQSVQLYYVVDCYTTNQASITVYTNSNPTCITNPSNPLTYPNFYAVGASGSCLTAYSYFGTPAGSYAVINCNANSAAELRIFSGTALLITSVIAVIALFLL